MKIKQGKEQEYQKAYDINKNDPYSHRVFTYAEDWATAMEEDFENRVTLDEPRIQQLGDQADYDGITGFMYDMARKVLYTFWEYGAELRDVLGNKMTSMFTLRVED
jgi:hypothetical protein